MPKRNRYFFRLLVPFGLLAVAVLAFIRRSGDDWEYEKAEEDAAVRKVALGSPTGLVSSGRTPSSPSSSWNQATPSTGVNSSMAASGSITFG